MTLLLPQLLQHLVRSESDTTAENRNPAPFPRTFKYRKFASEFEEFYKKVEETDCEFDPADQKRLADTCRMIENIRMEVIRIQARGIPAATTPVNESTVPEKKEYSMAELDSLTFSQLFRFGWALTMPLCIAVILAAILIGAAVILSFNGAFLW